MSIKLIYGENGDGKSLYAKNKGKEVIKLSSNIANWYDPKTMVISEFNYVSKDAKNKIISLESLLLSAKSSLSNIPGFKITNLKKFLSSINFNNLLQWNDYTNEEQNIDLEISGLIDLHSFIKNNHDSINGFSNYQKELIKLRKNFFYTNDNYLSEDAIRISEQLQNIQSELDELLSSIDLSIFEKMTAKDISRIFSEEAAEIEESVIKEIKNKIIESEEYQEIIRLQIEIINLKTHSITFVENEEKYTQIDNGYGIEIDLSEKKYSDGQKAAEVISIILNSVENTNKDIILDDLFEKLDTKSQEIVFTNISNSNNNFEILTHDVMTVGIIQSIASNNNIDIIEERISISGTQPNIDTTTTRATLTLSFAKLNQRIWNSKKNNDITFDEPIIIFAKLFGRYIAKAGAVSGSNLEGFELNENSDSYKFTSENLFHYNYDISFSLLNQIFPFDLNNNIDTCTFLDILLNKFDTNNRFGISFEKIRNYISEIKSFIEEEKRYWNSGEWSSEQLSQNKSIFYKNFWNGTEIIRPTLEKADRNMVEHRLDNSLISISV